MVKLHCESLAEQLLIPAFVFFFAMLYPFRRVSDPQSRLAAAAGGVMLVKRAAIDNIGGLERIKSELIDDCRLAMAIKHDGGPNKRSGRISLTLTEEVHSRRPYPRLNDIWSMVARTAYTQLDHSVFILVLTLFGMFLLYLLPILLLLTGLGASSLTGFAVWVLMAVLYMPTILFYGLPAWWAFSLPFAAIIYMGATIDSARLHHRQAGGQWKGRMQA